MECMEKKGLAWSQMWILYVFTELDGESTQFIKVLGVISKHLM